MELSALLHDIAMTDSTLDRTKHNEYGSEIAEKLLRENNYPEDKVQFVKKCILNHSGERVKYRTTEEERILEVGAGTVAYSLYYASKGYKVNAIEFVEHNLDILKSKITDNMYINAEQGDAVDLSRFKDNTFDITLVLGPLYHSFDDKDINKAISEAIRVTTM